MNNKNKNYQLGGMTNSSKGEMIGKGIGMAANLVIPGSGAILSPLLGSLGSAMGGKSDMVQQEQNRLNELNSSVNPYQYKLGGAIDAATYEGATHEEGGISINENGIPVFDEELEVEDDELLYTTKEGDKYVFSSFLDAQEGESFADKARQIESRYPKRDFNDIDKETFYLEMDRLRKAQDAIKSVIEEDYNQYKTGGYLKNKNTYITKDGKATRRGLWASKYLTSTRNFESYTDLGDEILLS